MRDSRSWPQPWTWYTLVGRVCEGEVYRLPGTLLLVQHSPGQTPPATRAEEAAACFEQALALARLRQAGAWELRAAMTLAQPWQQQGRREAARALFAPVYGRFTEGLDTADLREQRCCLTSSVRSRRPLRNLVGNKGPDLALPRRAMEEWRRDE
jgi:hypothetical protein